MIDRKSACPNQMFEMSGGTGSLRYMAPEVAKHLPYNHKVDTYSFGIILCELLSFNKSFTGLDIDEYFEKVVHSGLRPVINNKWPNQLNSLMTKCWSSDVDTRPPFNEVLSILDSSPTQFNLSIKDILPKRIILKSNLARLA